MISKTLPKVYQINRWYDNYATFLIKKEEKKEKIDITKIKLNKPKKQAYIDENVSLMKERIQILRKNPTNTEKLMNIQLTKSFGKASFIFQKGFFFKKHNFFYITDFYFPKQNLVVEIDGGYHRSTEQKEKDYQREKTLKRAFHVEILRFTNEQVEMNIFEIIKVITNRINPCKNEKALKNRKFQCKFCHAYCTNAKKLENHYKNSHRYTEYQVPV